MRAEQLQRILHLSGTCCSKFLGIPFANFGETNNCHCLESWIFRAQIDYPIGEFKNASVAGRAYVVLEGNIRCLARLVLRADTREYAYDRKCQYNGHR